MINNLQNVVALPRDRFMRVVFILFILFVVFLFLYSFTQIDLSLTLSRSPLWIPVQDFFKAIGYFKRPLSTQLYLAIFFGLSLLYVFLLYGAHEKKITNKQAFFLIGVTIMILLFSYNAFSYDLFNYIFDAKIITHYHENPYLKRALDFPHDPLLSFMHWTHRTYPYGPGWLLLTVPLSFVGLQYFLPTFFLYKIVIALSFLGCVYYLYKISHFLNEKHALFPVIFFACNPFVLIESLVSSHNDIVMMFFALLSLWFLVQSKYKNSVFALLFSISIKFATVLLLPSFLLLMYFQRKGKKIPWEKLFFFMIASMLVATIAASYRSNFQPWYLLYVMPFAAFVSRKYYVLIPSVIISLGSLFQYVPYLLLGNWNPPIPHLLWQVLESSIIVALIVTLLFGFYLRVRTASALGK